MVHSTSFMLLRGKPWCFVQSFITLKKNQLGLFCPVDKGADKKFTCVGSSPLGAPLSSPGCQTVWGGEGATLG